MMMSFRRLGVRTAVVTVFLENDDEFFFKNVLLEEETEQPTHVAVDVVVVVIFLSLSLSQQSSYS